MPLNHVCASRTSHWTTTNLPSEIRLAVLPHQTIGQATQINHAKMKIFRLQIFLYTTSAKANMCIKFDMLTSFWLVRGTAVRLFASAKFYTRAKKITATVSLLANSLPVLKVALTSRGFLKKSKLFAWQIRSRYVRTIRSDFFTASHFSSTIQFIFKVIWRQ